MLPTVILVAAGVYAVAGESSSSSSSSSNSLSSWRPYDSTTESIYLQTSLMYRVASGASVLNQLLSQMGTNISPPSFSPEGLRWPTSSMQIILSHAYELQEVYASPYQYQLVQLSPSFNAMSLALSSLLWRLSEAIREGDGNDPSPTLRALLYNLAQGYYDYASLLAPALDNAACYLYSSFGQAAIDPATRALEAASAAHADPAIWTFPSVQAQRCTLSVATIASFPQASTTPSLSDAFAAVRTNFDSFSAELQQLTSTYKAPIATTTGYFTTTFGGTVKTVGLTPYITTTTPVPWMPVASSLSQALHNARNAVPQFDAGAYSSYSSDFGSVASAAFGALEIAYNQLLIEDMPTLNLQISVMLSELSGIVANHNKAVESLACADFLPLYSTVDLFSQVGNAFREYNTNKVNGYVYFPVHPGAALYCLNSYTRPQLSWTNATQVASAMSIRGTSTTPTQTMPSSSSTFSLPPETGPKESDAIDFAKRIAIGVGIGTLFFLAGIIFLIVMCCKRRRQRAAGPPLSPQPEPDQKHYQVPQSGKPSFATEVSVSDEQQHPPNGAPPSKK